MKPEIAAIIWRSILEIREKGPVDITAGLCYNILSTGISRSSGLKSHEMECALQECFKTWPLYSGNPRYPVPAPNMSPGYAYAFTKNLWGGETPDEVEYAINRRGLMQHIFTCAVEVLQHNIEILRKGKS